VWTPGLAFLAIGLLCACMGPCAAILSGQCRKPASASLLALLAFLLGFHSGASFGWMNEELITAIFPAMVTTSETYDPY